MASKEQGLGLLSAAIPKSQVLKPYCPIQLVASGGFVSVMLLENRTASQDLDYFLSPRGFGENYTIVRAELERLIRAVAQRLRYVPDWANDQVTTFLTWLQDPQILFDESRRQDEILYQDDNMIIYAVKWEWVLARKLKRIQMPNNQPRREDWNDCAVITKRLYDAQGGKLSPSIVQLYDTHHERPVLPQTVMDLGRLVKQFYHVDAFPIAYWSFDTSTGFSYQWYNDSTKIERVDWPAMVGQIPVYLSSTREWKVYDSAQNNFGGNTNRPW